MLLNHNHNNTFQWLLDTENVSSLSFLSLFNIVGHLLKTLFLCLSHLSYTIKYGITCYAGKPLDATDGRTTWARVCV